MLLLTVGFLFLSHGVRPCWVCVVERGVGARSWRWLGVKVRGKRGYSSLLPSACVCVREKGLCYACLSALKPLMRARGGQILRNAPLNHITNAACVVCVKVLSTESQRTKNKVCVSILLSREVSICLHNRPCPTRPSVPPHHLPAPANRSARNQSSS